MLERVGKGSYYRSHWKNASHCHTFRKGDHFIAPADAEWNGLDENEYRLCDLIPEPGGRIVHTYVTGAS